MKEVQLEILFTVDDVGKIYKIFLEKRKLIMEFMI